MKLICKVNAAAIPTVEPQFLLNSALQRIPLFRLERIPANFKNANTCRFIVDENNNVVALVSDKFRLTQPREVINSLISPFVNELHSWKIYYGAGVVAARFVFNKLIELDDIHVRPGILLFDSVTKQYKLKIVAAPLVQECGNELLLRKAAFSRKHIGMIRTDLRRFIAEFKEWLYNLSMLKVMKDRMQKEAIDKETFNNILSDLKLPSKYVENLKWCDGYTLWNLYMDLTRRLTAFEAPLQYHVRVAKLVGV